MGLRKFVASGKKGDSKMIFDNEKPVTHAEAQEILKGDDIEESADLLLRLRFMKPIKNGRKG